MQMYVSPILTHPYQLILVIQLFTYLKQESQVYAINKILHSQFIVNLCNYINAVTTRRQMLRLGFKWYLFLLSSINADRKVRKHYSNNYIILRMHFKSQLNILLPLVVCGNMNVITAVFHLGSKPFYK